MDNEVAPDYIWESSSVFPVVLNGASINEKVSVITAISSKITITSAGTYNISVAH